MPTLLIKLPTYLAVAAFLQGTAHTRSGFALSLGEEVGEGPAAAISCGGVIPFAVAQKVTNIGLLAGHLVASHDE